MGASEMQKFEFSPDLSSADNIELFLSHLDGVDSNMSLLLRHNFALLFPFPEPGQGRTTVRQKFNSEIVKALDAEGSAE
jgi:hypothetical protein